MKRKHSQKDFLNALQSSRPTADAAFMDALKQKLLSQAEETLPEPHVSGLALIFQSMKRYSMAYVGVLILAAFGTLIFIPRSMDAEEFLAKAAENYQSREGIFHEELLSQRYENDVLVEASLEEIWADEENYKFIHLVRNPDTRDILRVTLSTTNEWGDQISYSSPIPNEVLDESEAEWSQIYEGEKFTCALVENTNENIYKTFLKISEEDPSVYVIDGEAVSLIEEPTDSLASLLSENTSASEIERILKHLENSSSEDYKVYTEVGDPNYWIYEWRTIDDRTAKYYFNADTYALEKMLLTFEEEPDRYDQTTYLAHEYLNEAPEGVFDPATYENLNLQMDQMITAGGPAFIEESGCYFKGEKLDEAAEVALLDQVPEEAIEDWQLLFEEMTMPLEDAIEDKSEETVIVPDVMGDWIRPTEGNITQAFREGHYAYDIANSEKPDILAADQGTVIEVGTLGGWNGGYGNYLIIDHGNGYTSLYSKCEEIYVEEGEIVTQGQVIAKMGNSGRVYGSTGIILHFELMYNGEKVDPGIMGVW